MMVWLRPASQHCCCGLAASVDNLTAGRLAPRTAGIKSDPTSGPLAEREFKLPPLCPAAPCEGAGRRTGVQRWCRPAEGARGVAIQHIFL